MDVLLLLQAGWASGCWNEAGGSRWPCTVICLSLLRQSPLPRRIKSFLPRRVQGHLDPPASFQHPEAHPACSRRRTSIWDLRGKTGHHHRSPEEGHTQPELVPSDIPPIRVGAKAGTVQGLEGIRHDRGGKDAQIPPRLLPLLGSECREQAHGTRPSLAQVLIHSQSHITGHLKLRSRFTIGVNPGDIQYVCQPLNLLPALELSLRPAFTYGQNQLQAFLGM